MITFEISINGKLLYRTGVGEFGMLTAEVMWARIQQRPEMVHEELSVHATSLAGGTDEHSEWPRAELRIGDEIRIKVVEFEKFEEPSRSGALESFRPEPER